MDKLIARTTASSHLFTPSAFPVDMPTLQIKEVPLSGIIRIQGRSDDIAFRTGIKAALQLELPAAERVAENAGVKLAWAGPNEVLCLCGLEKEDVVRTSLTQELANVFATVTLISDSRVVFVVSGPDAAALISKGCSIDSGASAFDVGHVVTTRFAGLPAMLMHRAKGEYVLFFDIGYTEFVAKWLIDAAEEFQL